jgi:hypothetical protein
LKYKQASFLLAVLLISTAPIFADKIPADSKSEREGGVSARALAEKQGLHDLYAAGDCGLSGVKEHAVVSTASSESRISHFVQSDKTSGLGVVNFEGNSAKSLVKLVDFGADHGNSDKNKGKSHGKGNEDNHDGDGTSPLVIAVSEPGSQLLLLIGLAGLGIFFLRRNSFPNAIG